MHKRITYESTLSDLLVDCAAACILLRLPTIKSSDLLFSPLIYVCMHFYSENLVRITSHHKKSRRSGDTKQAISDMYHCDLG